MVLSSKFRYGIELSLAIAAIGVLTMIGLTSFSTAHAWQLQGSLIGYNESTITVVDRQHESNCLNVEFTELTVRDSSGNAIRETAAGSQVILQAGVASCNSESQSVIVLFEVRDPDSLTNYVSWQNATVGSSGQITVNSSWIAPDRPGDYDVKSFAITCLNCPMALNPVLTYKLTVLPAA